MSPKIAALWDKHEGWVAPLAMAMFLWAGIKIGTHITETEQATACAATINGMSEQIGVKDARIIDKDRRLRTLQDTNTEGQQDLVEAAKTTAEAAAKSAAAAQKSAEAAAVSAGKTFETESKGTN